MLNRFKAQLHRHRTALGGLAVLLISLFVLAWVGIQTSRGAQNVSSYRMVNDVYDTVAELNTAPNDAAPAPLRQRLVLQKPQQLYGVRLDFATYDRVCRGQVRVRLLQGETEAAATVLEAVSLLDNTFADVVFTSGRPLQLEAGEYTLEVGFVPETPEDRLGLWAAEATQRDETGAPLPLQETGGTLALQLIEEYSGHWFLRYYAAVENAIEKNEPIPEWHQFFADEKNATENNAGKN